MRETHTVISLGLLLFLCYGLSPQAAAAPPSQDPLWKKAWRQLRSKESAERYKAIHWLSQQPEPLATKLLIQATKHGDPGTRWWAVTALRARPKPAALRGLFRALLRDTSERVRINAVMALLQQKDWAAIVTWKKKKLPSVRSVICLERVRQKRNNPNALVSCLRDRSALVRIQTARLLLKLWQPTSPFAPLRSMAQKVVASGVRYPFGPPRSRYSPQQQLAMAAQKLETYQRKIRRVLRKSSCFMARQFCSCLTRAYRRFRKQRRRFFDLEELYQARLKSPLSVQQRILSQALLAYRKGQVAYVDGSLCRQYKRRYRLRRSYRKLLRYRYFGPHLPLFLASSSQNFLRVTTGIWHDTAIDILRDDLYPTSLRMPPSPRAPQDGFVSQSKLELSYHVLLNKRWLLHAQNRFTAMVTEFPQRIPHGIDNRLRLSLMYRRHQRRKSVLFFITNQLHYTPNPPDQEGFPDQFSGLRLSQQARTGFALRWGHLHRRNWLRRHDWLLHVEYRNHIQWPLLAQSTPRIWSRRMTHRWNFALSRQISFFRLGLRSFLQYHQMWDLTAQIPTLQWDIFLTGALGDVFSLTDIARLEFGIGFNLSQPLSVPSHPSIPLEKNPPTHAGQAAYVRATGFTPKLPLQWCLQYNYRAGPPQRPLFPFFLEHHIRGWLRIGNIRQIDPFHPRNIHIDIGLAIRLQIYKPFQNPNEAEATKPEPTTIQTGALSVQVGYPIWRGLRIVVGDRLSLIDNQFVLYGKDNGTTTAIRNMLYVQLEYWLGGRHQDTPTPYRTP